MANLSAAIAASNLDLSTSSSWAFLSASSSDSIKALLSLVYILAFSAANSAATLALSLASSINFLSAVIYASSLALFSAAIF